MVNIRNNGNAPGHFRWNFSSRVFSVEPMECLVPARNIKPVKITYAPQGLTTKAETEKLTLIVTDGEDQMLTCVGEVKEARCYFKG